MGGLESVEYVFTLFAIVPPHKSKWMEITLRIHFIDTIVVCATMLARNAVVAYRSA